MNYDYTAAKAYCDSKGLIWWQAGADAADPVFLEIGLTQAQVDRIVMGWCDLIAHIFNPKSYTWKQRAALAAHFLTAR